MVGTGDDDDRRANLVWSAEADTYFLRLQQGFYSEHGTIGKIDTHTWKSWSNEMRPFFQVKPPYRKLQSKRDRMRAVWKAWEVLLDTTGVG